LDLVLAGFAAGALTFSLSCTPKRAVNLNNVVDDYRQIFIEQTLERDPFNEVNPNNKNPQLLKQIHDNPYQSKNIETAIKKGVNPANIYNAIGWGVTQLQEQNDKKLKELRVSESDFPNGHITDVLKGTFQDSLWKKMHYIRVLEELKNRYNNGSNPQAAMDAVQYWLGVAKLNEKNTPR